MPRDHVISALKRQGRCCSDDVGKRHLGISLKKYYGQSLSEAKTLLSSKSFTLILISKCAEMNYLNAGHNEIIFLQRDLEKMY